VLLSAFSSLVTYRSVDPYLKSLSSPEILHDRLVTSEWRSLRLVEAARK
jgi:hypothetical protein